MENINSNGNDLRELVRALERNLGMLEDSGFTCCGVTLTQCAAMVEIGRAGKISLNALAVLLGLEDSTMSRTVNNLVVRGIAVREADPADRRSVSISLTDKGRKLFDSVEKTMNRYYGDILSRIPEEKRAHVIDSLRVLLDAIEQSECCGTNKNDKKKGVSEK